MRCVPKVLLSTRSRRYTEKPLPNGYLMLIGWSWLARTAISFS